MRDNILARSLRAAAAGLAVSVLTCCHARNAAPVNSSTLTVAVRKEPISLNPLLLEGINAYIFSEVFYSYLTIYDEHGEIAGDLAREVPSYANGGVSADGRTVTFRLRRGVRWQDGAPVTASDVAFTYRAVMNPRNNVPERYGYDVVERLDTPDRYTVRLRLKRAFAPILSTFFGGDSNYPILPAHLLASLPNVNAVPFDSAPVGSGPYKLARWDRGDRIVADANPAYYAGKPRIEHLVMPFVSDDSTVINQLKTGEVNAAFFVDTSRVAELRAIPDHRLVITPVPYFYAISYNLDDPVLADRSVRLAIAQGLDNRSLVRKATRGLDDAAHAMRGLFTWAYDPSVKPPAYDPAAAKALLTNDGWMPGPDGIRVKNGKRLSLQLSFATGQDVTTDLATAIAAALRPIGIDVSLRSYDRNLYVSVQGPWEQGHYQLSLYDYQGLYDPDASWMLACDQRAPHGFNMSRYCTATVDALLHKAAASYDRASRIAAYRAIQRQITEDVAYDFLCQINEVDVIPSNLGGYVPPLLSPYNFVARWYWVHPAAERSQGATSLGMRRSLR